MTSFSMTSLHVDLNEAAKCVDYTQPCSQGVLTSYADHEAEARSVIRWYTSITFAQKMGKFESHYGFHRWLGNAKPRKMAVALALILQKMNGEIGNKHFEDLI